MEKPTQEGLVYLVDPKWYEEHKKSLPDTLQARRCSSCQKKTSDKGGPAGGWEEQMKKIVECCSKKPTWFSSRTPALESAFRLILANSNRPLPFATLYEQITNLWSSGESPRYIAKEVLVKMLDMDDFYGIRSTSAVRTTP
ncbi:MAG: hypothetical protein HYU29_00445 [Chloroflexi bacterium]|nr:hypothetical protein [Chloroflexota bacterium]